MTQRRSATFLAALVLAPLTTAACVTGDDRDRDVEGAVASELGPCTVSGTDINKSLVITDPAILAAFPFRAVFDRIRTTGAPGTLQTNTGIFQQWMRTFAASVNPGDCDDATIDPNGYGLVCPRLPEAKLATIDPFAEGSNVTFEPVGLFNRFDLTPTPIPSSYSSGGTCGEYRIVYAMKSTNPNIGGRAFIIFEAALPNSTLSKGATGCLAVAKFWQSLTDDPSLKSRATKLHDFYFTDNTVPGFPAAINAAHYGLATPDTKFGPGQIRTNFFVDSREWHLREFKLRNNGNVVTTPRLTVDHVTVKANPADELFRGTHANTAAFRTNFTAAVDGLASNNVNTIALSNADRFNEFESISQGSNLPVDYNLFADATIRGMITARLAVIGSTLTDSHILLRATTQTCGGCHQVSNNDQLGGGLIWPASGTFVQINESSALSTALTTQFLPHRKDVLEDFINKHCFSTSPIISVPGKTIGGGSVDGAN